MSVKQKNTVSKQSGGGEAAVNIFRGVISGIICFIVFLAATSLIVLKTAIAEKYFCILVLAVCAISSFVCAMTSCIKNKSRNLVIGMTSSIALLVLEFLVLLCFNSASVSNNLYFIIPANLILGFIGCVIGSNIRKK